MNTSQLKKIYKLAETIHECSARHDFEGMRTAVEKLGPAIHAAAGIPPTNLRPIETAPRDGRVIDSNIGLIWWDADKGYFTDGTENRRTIHGWRPPAGAVLSPAINTAEPVQDGAWHPFAKGETALDLGVKYAFANPKERQFEVRWSHDAPSAATACAKVSDLLADVVRALTSKGDGR